MTIRSYAVCVVAAFLVAGWIRAREVRRLGYDRDPRHVWVGVGALLGAILGAKFGLVLFGPNKLEEVWQTLLSLDLTGKTVLGGIAGGWAGVEVAKWTVGIRASTGDGFALALPVGQGIGRIGCLLEGCCFGVPSDGVWAVVLEGVRRHPVQLYEAALDGVLALWLWSCRGAGRPAGHLFRRAVVGYAAVRMVLDPLRDDGRWMIGPLSAVQWACLAVVVTLGARLVWVERR